MVFHDRIAALVYRFELMFGSSMMHWLYDIQYDLNDNGKPFFWLVLMQVCKVLHWPCFNAILNWFC